MGSLSDEIHDFLDANRVGVLATEATDGHPRQSLVCVIGRQPPYPSATFSGPAEIRTEHIGTPTARLMQRIAARRSRRSR